MRIDMELTEQEKRQLLQNSVERMINTSITLATRAEASSNATASDLGSTSRQDWEELKELTVKLWNEARNAVFKELSNGKS